MSFVRQSIDAVRHATRVFFRSQLRLQWRSGPKLALVETGPARAPTAEERAQARAREELVQIKRELAEVLNDSADIRDSLRHLVFVEQALQQDGLAALYQVPLEVLQTALDQFEGLISNWSPLGLASLRSRMAVAVSERQLSDNESALQTAPAVSSPRPASRQASQRAADRRVSVRES